MPFAGLLAPVRPARSILALSLFAGLAIADVPTSLDRVPADAPVVVAVRSAEGLSIKIEAWAKESGAKLDEGDDNPLNISKKLLSIEGVKKDGSLAFVLPAGYEKYAEEKKAGEEDEDGGGGFSLGSSPALAVVPVTDAGAFLKAMGAKEGTGTIELSGPEGVEGFGGPIFGKDLGGGYVLLGSVKEVVEAFDGAAGRTGAHKKALGSTGLKVADAADVVLIGNIPALAPGMAKAFEEGIAGAAQNMAMMGGGAGASLETVKVAVNGYLRDAQIGVAGLSFDSTGVVVDLASQFKEGSEVAKFFAKSGRASTLSTSVPNIPFMALFSVDTSAPGIKQIIKNFGQGAEKKASGDEFAGAWRAAFDRIDSVDGVSFLLGATPGLFAGGLFANTVQYVATSDAPGYVQAVRASIEAVNSKTIEGVTYDSKYEPGAVDLGGTKVDRWSALMQVDPNHPSAMQVQQAQMMMFGPTGGPAGFVAPVGKGVVSSFAQNSKLMTDALKAASDGNGLGDSEAVKAGAAKLPADRTFEAFIGTKSLLDLAVGAMAMMGGGADIKVPDSIPPVSAGGTTDNGAFHLRVHVPTEVVKTIRGIAKSMQGGGDEEPGEAAPADTGKPRF